jgi:hypothetical protein
VIDVRTGHSTLAVAATLLVVTGCTATTSGAPRPAGTRRPTVIARFGAPAVTTRLDTTKYQADPCDTLTAGQLSALGITQPGKITPSDDGAICAWSPRYDVSYAVGFNTRFDPGAAAGLANAYQTAGPGSMTRLPDVHGQPAATQTSQNTDGSCTIYLVPPTRSVMPPPSPSVRGRRITPIRAPWPGSWPKTRPPR